MNYDQTFERLKLMPALSHWPNRPAKFSWQGSQVIAHIRRVAQCDIIAAARIFERARDKRVLLFDHARLTWSGNRAWVPMPRRKQAVSASR